MVRCSTCGNRWRAYQDRAESESETPEDDLLVEERPLPAPPDDDIEFVAAPVTPSRRPAPKRRPVGLYVVATVGVGLAALAGLAVILRQQVATAMPATAPLFAGIGLPVNTLGLVIESVKSQAVLQAGRPALSVTGAIRNTRDGPVQAPPIRINLLDKGGKQVSTTLIQPLNGKVPPGATRYFAISLPAPPAALHDLEIRFEPAEANASTAVAAETHATAEAAPPAEAQPLPPGSPDALKKHE